MDNRFKFRVFVDGEMFYQEDQYLSSFIQRVYIRLNVSHPSYLDFQIEDILMQCTTLKDIKGDLIYTDDRLKSIDGLVGTVKWDRGRYVIDWDGTDEVVELFYFGVYQTLEIIGNIHDTKTEKTKKQELNDMMLDERYWKKQEPDFVKKVVDGFKEIYGEQPKNKVPTEKGN